MSSPSRAHRETFHRLLFRDTLNALFRCGHCGASMTGSIGFGRLRDAALIEVPCPHCKQRWTFTRTLSTLCPNQEISQT